LKKKKHAIAPLFAKQNGRKKACFSYFGVTGTNIKLHTEKNPTPLSSESQENEKKERLTE
jgi:hypothetical protein